MALESMADTRKILAVIVTFAVIAVLAYFAFGGGDTTTPTSKPTPTPKPADFWVALFLSPSGQILAEGREINVGVTVENRGDLAGTIELTVEATMSTTSNMHNLGQLRTHVEGGEEEAAHFSFTPDDAGDWTVLISEEPKISIKLNVLMCVEAEQLAAEYEANEVAADLKYKDTVFYVEGYIDDIGKSLVGDYPTISLEAYGVFNDIQCEFKKSEVEKVAKVNLGEWVMIKGKGEGRALGLWIYMEDCELVETK